MLPATHGQRLAADDTQGDLALPAPIDPGISWRPWHTYQQANTRYTLALAYLRYDQFLQSCPCEWINGPEAFKRVATHIGKTQSARHIKPLHWYVACRLVLEGGFNPEDITPQPPFRVERKGKGKYRRARVELHYDESQASWGEQAILGGLKTKNVDVVVSKDGIGPVLAISCKGVTKAFRNLTNRMEETIGECTNLHITYPAMFIGYFALMRANHSIEDALEAPDMDAEDTPADVKPTDDDESTVEDGVEESAVASEDAPTDDKKQAAIKANDIAILEGNVADGIFRFHNALAEMTMRRGIRDEISRYEAMTMALIEPHGSDPGSVFPDFPRPESPLHMSNFFDTLYRRYDERFVLGAPSLAAATSRFEWDPDSPVFARIAKGAAAWPALDFESRLGPSSLILK